MTAQDILEFLQSRIHSTIVATVDDDGLPVTCVIDMMLADADGLYFLTARGKAFYQRLIAHPFVALTGLRGESTMTSVSVNLRGDVRPIGTRRLGEIFEKNPPHGTDLPDGGLAGSPRGLPDLAGVERALRPLAEADLSPVLLVWRAGVQRPRLLHRHQQVHRMRQVQRGLPPGLYQPRRGARHRPEPLPALRPLPGGLSRGRRRTPLAVPGRPDPGRPD